MRNMTAAIMLLAALTPALAVQQLTDTAPLLSGPMLGFDGTAWQANSDNPQAFRVGMIKTPGTTDSEAAVIVSRPDAPREAKGGIAQSIDAAPWRGQRVRLTARLKTLDATEVQIRMHVISGPSADKEMLRTMMTRPIAGTRDWQAQDIVMDVPDDARDIVYGFYLRGSGAAFGDAFKIEAVGRNIQLTRPPLGLGFSAPSMVRSLSADAFQNGGLNGN